MAEEVESAAGEASDPLRSIAHDLGNLAYRLTFLRHNLAEMVPDPARREEATALLDDTAGGLKRAADALRRLGRNE